MTYLLLLAVLHLADGYTTHMILKSGGRELNPLLARLFARIDHRLVLAAKGGAVVMIAYALGSPAPEVLCALSAVVVAWNLYVIKLRRATAEALDLLKMEA